MTEGTQAVVRTGARSPRTAPPLFEVAALRHHRRRTEGPLGHLSWEERHAVAYLEKGGFWPDVIRGRGGFTGRRIPDEWRYQVWLFDNAKGEIC